MIYGTAIRHKRTYRMLHIPTGRTFERETAKACALRELLEQVNEWNRSNPSTYVYYVPQRTQPEIGDLNVPDED